MFERYFTLLVEMWYGLLELCDAVFNVLTHPINFAGETIYVFDILFTGAIGGVLITRFIIWAADQVIPN